MWRNQTMSQRIDLVQGQQQEPNNYPPHQVHTAPLLQASEANSPQPLINTRIAEHTMTMPASLLIL